MNHTSEEAKHLVMRTMYDETELIIGLKIKLGF